MLPKNENASALGTQRKLPQSKTCQAFLFSVRFDVPFPDDDAQKLGVRYRSNPDIVQRDVHTKASKPPFCDLHKAASIEKKMTFNNSGEDKKFNYKPAGARRAAVFDHHSMSDLWSKEEVDIETKRLPQLVAEENREDHIEQKNCLDRKIEKTAKSTPPYASMSEVNQMRTERLANAIKALEVRHADDQVARTQSMRNPHGLHESDKPLDKRRLEKLDLLDPLDEKNFRPRTSSVPCRRQEGWAVGRTASKSNPRPPYQFKPHHGNKTSSMAVSCDKIENFRGSSPAVDGHVFERTRTFIIDPNKAAVINRGDSFRRRCNTTVTPRQQQMFNDTANLFSPSSRCQSPTQAYNASSKNSSNLSSRSHSPMPLGPYGVTSPPLPLSPSGGVFVKKYHIVVLGSDGVGKTAIINQFMTSDYCNPFQMDTASERVGTDNENTVNVILDGEESQLTFIEVDNRKNDLWLSLSAAAYIVVYGIDDSSTFANAQEILCTLRQQPHSADRPIVLVANKVDLERKRTVPADEGKAVAKENECKFLEIAVALGHHVDELLVGTLAQIRQTEACCADVKEAADDNCMLNARHLQKRGASSSSASNSSSGSIAAVTKPLEQHQQPNKNHKKLFGPKHILNAEPITTSCSNLTSVGHLLVDKFFGRRRESRSLEDLLNLTK